MAQIELGTEVRDEVTGFAGRATARATYLYGTPRVLVEACGADGKLAEEWFDEQRLDAVATSPEA